MPSRAELRVQALDHPDLGPGELWAGANALRAALARLPSGPPFARILPGQGPRGEAWVEGGMVLALDRLGAPMPVAAAVVLLHDLAEEFADLHDQGDGHGCFSPASVGWTSEGLVLVRPDPALAAGSPGHPEDGIQIRDCQALGALLWTALGGPWPMSHLAAEPGSLPHPGISAEVACALPRICRGDARLELVLRGMLRWGGGYRLAPARAVRQALAALRFRHGASDEALQGFLAERGVPSAAGPARRPAPRREDPPKTRHPPRPPADLQGQSRAAVPAIEGPGGVEPRASRIAPPASTEPAKPPSAPTPRAVPPRTAATSLRPAPPPPAPPPPAPNPPPAPVPPSAALRVPPRAPAPLPRPPPALVARVLAAGAQAAPRRRVTLEIPVEDGFPLMDADGLFVAPPSLDEEEAPGPAPVVQPDATRPPTPLDSQEDLGREASTPIDAPTPPPPAPVPVPEPSPPQAPIAETAPAPAPVAPPGPEPPPTPLDSVEGQGCEVATATDAPTPPPEVATATDAPTPPPPAQAPVPEPAPAPDPIPEPAPAPAPVAPPEPEPPPTPLDSHEGQGREAAATTDAPPAPPDPAASDLILERRPPAPDPGTPWLPGVGISSRHEREQELGSGKWTEPARSLDEVRAGLPTEPIRELHVRPQGFRWRLALGAFVALAVLLWWLATRSAPEEPSAPPTPPADPSPATPPEAREALDAPEVTIWTDQEGARVELDGRDQGPAPTRVPVPLDRGTHELCLVVGAVRTCRALTGEQIAQEDPYAFTLGDGSP